MKSNFDVCLAEVLKHEGGYVDHPKDPGGATNLGITIGTLSDWLGHKATKAEVKALTVAKVAPIYKKNYWDRVRGDDLPIGLDYAVFDFAVNSGVSRASIYLQNIVGAAPDGKIGNLTLQNIARGTPKTMILDLCSQRLAFLERLSTWPTFGKGWRTRVAGVRDKALQMAVEPPKSYLPPDNPIKIEPAEPIKDKDMDVWVPEVEPKKSNSAVLIITAFIVLAVVIGAVVLLGGQNG